MKRTFLTALISTSLILPQTISPMPVWANSGTDEIIEESSADAQAKWQQGSAGFFKFLADQGDADASRAYQIITAKDGSLQNGMKRTTDYSGYTHLGQKYDATSLDNMKEAIRYLELTNAKRQEENRTMKTSLKDLRVSSSLMAISQWQTNASRDIIGHSQAFYVAENLSWGYSNPLDGWYDEEKAIYLDAISKGQTPNQSDVGHYLNVVNSGYSVMGAAAVVYGSAYGTVSGQTFNFSSDRSYTVAEYKELFMNYYNSLKSQLDTSKPSISTAAVSGINSQYTYSGKAISPVPTVTLNGTVLKAGTDYTVSYSNNVNTGRATVTITGKGNYSGVITKTFEIVKTATNQPAPSGTNVSMYRLYNPNSGEHFYTANSEEKDHLVVVGWTYEGIGWNAPKMSKIPVYRLYNPNAGDHHYTMSKEERDTLVKIGWNDEGTGWYSDEAKGVPLYRQYNPNAKAGSHNYTIDKGENDGLVRLGWKAEGIGWYGVK